ncbi:MAG: hypothetical protein QNJ30_19105 [Kiloniellales bacterium]|nr:hypothetical protein [Kiloniellales bacterium]
MDILIRALAFSTIGLVLLTANLWFLRAVYRQFLDSEYVISPFNIVDPKGKTPEGAGLAMAQMMAGRLVSIQTQLEAARETPAPGPSDPSDTADPLGATALFITRPVEIPTDLFEPVEIRASVGGVEVGGLLSYLQRQLAVERAIHFSLHQQADNAVLTADFGAFAPDYGALWFETGSDPGEIAAYAAYALLHARLSESRQSRIRQLDLAAFRGLIETVIAIDAANRKALQGYVVDDQLAQHLRSLEGQLRAAPGWPELIYMVASTAEGIGNTGKAVSHYRKLVAMPKAEREGANLQIFDLAEARLAALGTTAASVTAEAETRFVAAAAEFARRMNLPGADPAIAFVAHEVQGVQAIWNREKRRYEVNPPFVDTAGLPQYVALMGRFLDRHIERCFAQGAAQPDVQFWNQFRYAVVDYLIQSNAEFSKVAFVGSTYPLFAALKAIEGIAGAKATQRLGLALLDRFDCDWSYDRLEAEMLAINADLALMDAAAIRQGVATAGLGAADEGR